MTAPSIPRDLRTILGDIDRLEREWQGKAIPQPVGDQLESLYAEGKTLQDTADRNKRRQSLETFAREVPNPTMPGRDREATATEVKTAVNTVQHRITGYMRVGEFLANNELLQKYISLRQRGEFAVDLPSLLKIKSIGMKTGLVPLTKDMREMIESKDLAVVGEGVIEPMRVNDLVREQENDELTMRDVLNVSPTSAALIQWVQRVGAPDRSAAIQSEGNSAAVMALKPEADAEYEVQETSVKTIAVWIPVTEQQLQDMPVLVNLIEQDLLYDLRKEEEEQVVWGDGTGLNLDGLDANITEATAGSLTTNIDLIRRCMTEIKISGYSPTAVAIHPTEWEGIELEKGSDGHYIWAIIRDTLGPRIWGMRVVETVAMDDPDSANRLIIVGDFKRGATLFDRMQPTIAIGWKDDDFIRNLRTIRAEERVAFAVRRPLAFRKITVS